MRAWLVLLAACVSPSSGPSGSRAGIQIGQESGGCEHLRSAVALDDASWVGFAPRETLPESFGPAELTWEPGDTTPLRLDAVLTGASWVQPQPTRPDGTGCDGPGWLEVTLGLSLISGDGALDEQIEAVGVPGRLDDGVHTTGRVTMEARDVRGTLHRPDMQGLFVTWALSDRGDHSGAVSAALDSGAVEPVGTWSTEAR